MEKKYAEMMDKMLDDYVASGGSLKGAVFKAHELTIKHLIFPELEHVVNKVGLYHWYKDCAIPVEVDNNVPRGMLKLYWDQELVDQYCKWI